MATLNSRPPREQSRIRETFIEADAGPPYTVHADCILTRRKRHHIITDRAEGVVFRSRWFSDIVEWLASNEQSSYTVVTDRGRWKVSISADQ